MSTGQRGLANSQSDAQSEVKEYVPDVICRHCGQLINLPRESYSWYAGEVTCRECQCTLYVEIGDYQSLLGGTPIPTHLPFPNAPGGRVLRTPKVVRRPNAFPIDLVHGTESEKIPAEVKDPLRTAIRAFDDERYADAAVRCRVVIESALRQQGVQGSTPSSMVDEATRDRLLFEPYEKYGQIIVAAGGQGAHAPRPPITRDRALLLIGLTADLLRMLYDIET